MSDTQDPQERLTELHVIAFHLALHHPEITSVQCDGDLPEDERKALEDGFAAGKQFLARSGIRRRLSKAWSKIKKIVS
jgi:hypothetical protein